MSVDQNLTVSTGCATPEPRRRYVNPFGKGKRCSLARDDGLRTRFPLPSHRGRVHLRRNRCVALFAYSSQVCSVHQLSSLRAFPDVEMHIDRLLSVDAVQVHRTGRHDHHAIHHCAEFNEFVGSGYGGLKSQCTIAGDRNIHPEIQWLRHGTRAHTNRQ